MTIEGVEKIVHSGALRISEFVEGPGTPPYLLTETYYGYTRREAVADYKRNLRELGLTIWEG